MLGPLAAAAPTDVARQRDVARADIGLAIVELQRGRIAAARSEAANVERRLGPLFEKTHDTEAGRALAEGRLAAAEAAERSGDRAGALTLRESALSVVRSVLTSKSKRVIATQARALIALGRLDEARPIVTELLRMNYRQPLLIQAWKAKGGVLDSALASKSR